MTFEPQIIFENADFLVVNKPAGLMVHGVRRGSRLSSSSKRPKRQDSPIEPTLVDWLLVRYPEIAKVGDAAIHSGQLVYERPGIVHRLDKDTSGVMLVARHQASFEYLKSLFQKHEILKTYLAVVTGKPQQQQGTIDAPIGILTGSTRRSVRSTKMLKEAKTEWCLLSSFKFRHPQLGVATEHVQSDVASLLEVHPKTGRTHQIRVHLASIGHPILGDPLYGTKISRAAASRLMLHALSIEFVTSDGRRVRFEAEAPEGFRV